MKEKINIKNLEKLIKESKCQILATSNGVMLNGKDTDILTLLASIVKTISSKTNIHEDMIKFAFILGIEKDTKNKNTDEIIDTLFNDLSELFK